MTCRRFLGAWRARDVVAPADYRVPAGADLRRASVRDGLGRKQRAWLAENIPGYRALRAAIGQWRTRVLLDRYRARRQVRS
jgi:hypothetical protein